MARVDAVTVNVAEPGLTLSGKPARGARVTPLARLLHFHRNDATHVLVLGGTAQRRTGVAHAFHRGSFLRHGPFVAVDGAREDDQLRESLNVWMSCSAAPGGGDPLAAAEHGTLFIDSIGALSLESQRALLAFIQHCVNATPSHGDRPWNGRVIAGDPGTLPDAAALGRFTISLFDSLDKVRVELPREGA